ncbi:MAG: hypothetical protein ABI718_09900 [Acidobacteriota bacterium]
MPVSRGFVSAMAGVAITVFAWFSPWEWPAWPALTVLASLETYSEMSYAGRASVVVALIFLNVAFWATVIFLLTRIAAEVSVWWRDSRPRRSSA